MFFDFRRAKKSFLYAFWGLKTVWKEEQNFRFHSLTGLLVVLFAVLLGVNKQDFIIILVIIGLVLILELINTIFERLIDILKPRIHDYSKTIKNVSSAVVLLASFLSLFIGILIFYPYVKSVLFDFFIK